MNLNLNLAARIGLNLVALLGGIAVLRLGKDIFLPLIFAVLLATILWPSANRLHRFYRLPWTLSCITAVGGLVFFNVVVVTGAVLAVPRLLQTVPNPNNPAAQEEYYHTFRNQVIAISPFQINDEYLPEKPEDSRLFMTVKKTLDGDYVLQAVLSALSYVASYTWQLILVLFILLFLLMEGRMLTRRVVESFGPAGEVQSKVTSALRAIAQTVRDFLVWRTIVNIGLAVIVGVVYQLLGLKQAWVWALLTGVLCYIPYIGPIIAGGPPLLDALINTNGLIAIVVLAFYTGIIILEGYVVVPLLMGRHMDLNATTVMIGCIFWDLVWGVPGLFLAMPLLAAAKAVCEHVPGWEPIGRLMSAEDSDAPAPALSKHARAMLDPERTIVMPPDETPGRA